VYGIRNSYLFSIVFIGIVSLVFVDNVFNGIELLFFWMYWCKKCEVDGSIIDYVVEDHVWWFYCEFGGDVN
jgi:hypothetical protein